MGERHRGGHVDGDIASEGLDGLEDHVQRERRDGVRWSAFWQRVRRGVEAGEFTLCVTGGGEGGSMTRGCIAAGVRER